MSDRLGTSAMILAVSCAVVMTALAIKREYGALADISAKKPVLVTNWKELASGGHRTGDSAAAVTVVEIIDFECPFCSHFAKTTIPWLAERHAEKVSFVYRHLPLKGHANAYPAARAAECAGEQGRFSQFASLLFAKQDSIGRRNYQSFARDADVPDLKAFELCNALTTPVAAIERDIALAEAAGANATPTVIVNGYRAHSPLALPLDSLIKRELARHSSSH